MPDPLRSLAELVRTLTRSRTEKRGPTPSRETRPDVADSTAPRQLTGSGRADVLRERLSSRLKLVGTTDARAAREAFVEIVLATELGEDLALDPAMAEIVARVSRQLASDPTTERDLGALLDELARQPS
jgi:hypothetical protein